MYFFKNNTVKVASFCGKLLLANVVAILALSFFLPLFYTPNSPSSTLFGRPFPHRSPNSCVYNTFYEGYTSGILDANGFNNLYCIEHNIPVPSPKPSKRNLSLLFGDSHMEAYHVPMNKNCSYLVNKELESIDQDFLLYNIAFNGLGPSNIITQFDEAIDYFQPRFSVVVELRELPDPIEAKQILAKNEGQIRSDTFCAQMEKNKYARFVLERTLALRMILHTIEVGIWTKKDSVGKNQGEEWNEENVVYLRELLKKFSEPSRSRGIQPIIFYHSPFTLHVDGSATLNEDSKIVELYRNECEKQGIVFLYLGDRFIKEYEENNVLPYGFWNTIPNAGHLNQDGHRMIAEELCKVIEQLEETRKKNVNE